MFLVTPGLRKFGNGWGSNLEEEMILVPAAVVCADDGE
jgi:hypothetical protein